MAEIAFFLAFIALCLKYEVKGGCSTRVRLLWTESELSSAILAGRASFNIFKVLIEVAYILKTDSMRG